MSNLTLAVVCTALGALVGLLIRVIFEKQTVNQMRIDLARKEEELLQRDRRIIEIEALKDREVAQARKEKCPFTVQVTPFVFQEKRGGLFSDTHILQQGVQYQMFVNGVPCFEPHLIVEQTMEESSVDPKKLKELADLAFESAQNYISLHATSARKFFNLTEAAVRRLN